MMNENSGCGFYQNNPYVTHSFDSYARTRMKVILSVRNTAYTFLVPHCCHRRLTKCCGRPMTYNTWSEYCPPLDRWLAIQPRDDCGLPLPKPNRTFTPSL